MGNAAKETICGSHFVEITLSRLRIVWIIIDFGILSYARGHDIQFWSDYCHYCRILLWPFDFLSKNTIVDKICIHWTAIWCAGLGSLPCSILKTFVFTSDIQRYN